MQRDFEKDFVRFSKGKDVVTLFEFKCSILSQLGAELKKKEMLELAQITEIDLSQGNLNFEEFMKMANAAYHKYYTTRINECYAVFDIRRKGWITAEDFERVLFVEAPNYCQRNHRMIFDSADIHGIGKITLNQFINFAVDGNS